MSQGPQSNRLDELFFSSARCYHLRVTHPDGCKRDELYALYAWVSYVIVCTEISKKGVVHNHLLLGEDESVDNTQLKEQIVKVLKEKYPENKGNKFYECTVAKDKDSLRKYVVKDGDYIYKGFTKSFMDDTFKVSYSKDKFKAQYKKLREDVLVKRISLSKYCEALIQLKADSEQGIYLNHIEAHVRAIGIKVGEIEPRTMSDRVMERIFS